MPEPTDDTPREKRTDSRRDETLAAGPLVPPGETEPVAPKSSGREVKGVQPQTEDDIPEAGR